MSKKRLITSALPYVNNEPHLGNLIGCVLSADVFARFCRSRGYETLYICGTDEYGTATETKAAAEGVTPREICDKYHTIHDKIYKHFNIQFDAFGRTSTPEHTEVVQSTFKQVYEKGYLIEQESEQYYSESQQKFLADRLIEGTCPKCQYEDARGDQCDNCGSMLTPTELINPRSATDGSTPTLKKTRHLYLDFNKIKDQLEAFQNNAIIEGFWPNNAKTTTQSWMKMELQPRAITRDLKWGVPVPKEGFDSKVFYVWFDAPIGYVSITARAFPDTWENWWHDPENTELFQFMAKDNIPFHSLMFPATQLATGQNWTKVHHLASTEYLNYEDTKFSKSRNTGVFGTDVINSDIAVDLWRFYLLAIRPEKQDSAFCWQEFFDKANNEFIDNIGNLVNRSLVYTKKNFDGTLQEANYDDAQEVFIKEAQSLKEQITATMEKSGLREGMRLILSLGKAGNRFFQEQEPWVKIKEDKNQVQATVNILVHLVRDIATYLSPFMPETAERIFAMLNIEPQTWEKAGDFNNLIGQTIGKPQILFTKLDTARVEELKQQFSGVKKVDPWDKIELRVGKIVEIKRHPEAERLYVEKIDLGEGRLRTIVSGLVKFCSEDELLGKKVIVASNLKEAKLRGVLSEGMVLAASTKKKLEVLDAGNAEIGTIVHRTTESPTARTEEIDIDTFLEATMTTQDGKVLVDGKELQINDQTLTTEIVLKGKVS